jgi:hypothetical protein
MNSDTILPSPSLILPSFVPMYNKNSVSVHPVFYGDQIFAKKN